MVDAIAHIDIELTGGAKERFVPGGAAPVAVAGGFRLGIGLGFHDQSPQHLSGGLAFHQPATDELRGHHLGGPSEKGAGEKRGGDGRW